MPFILNLAFYFEIILIPVIFVIFIYMGYHIIKRNMASNINRCVGSALIVASVAMPGTLIRSIFSFYDVYYKLGYFERIWRHIDMYLAFFFYFLILCGFWLLLQEPDQQLHFSFYFTAGIITIIAIVDCFMLEDYDHIVILTIVSLILAEFVAIMMIIYKIYNDATPSKRRRIKILGMGSIMGMLGFIFISISSYLRIIDQHLVLAIIFESIVTWVSWLAGAILFYKGMPTKEDYFFDELNQSIVYGLKLPKDTNLDDLFLLIKRQLNITKQEVENELKNREYISSYIKEITVKLKEKGQ